MPPARPGRSPAPSFALVSLFALIALLPLSWAATHSEINPRARLADLASGAAWRPYVYRLLAPRAAGAIEALTPGSVRAAADSALVRSPRLAAALRWDPEHAVLHAASLAISWASLVLFALAFAALAVRDPRLAPRSTLAAVLALLGVAVHFGYQNFAYDFPQLGLFAFGLWAIAAGRWRTFYVAYALALLNKETSILLAFAFAIEWSGRLPRRALLGHIAAQLALAVGITLAIRAACAASPGAPVEHHFARNLAYRPQARQLMHDLAYLALWVLAVLGARGRPRVALAAFAVLAPLVVATLAFGFLGEYRDFYEAYPLAALLALGAMLGGRARKPASAAAPAA